MHQENHRGELPIENPPMPKAVSIFMKDHSIFFGVVFVILQDWRQYMLGFKNRTGKRTGKGNGSI